MPVDIVRLFDSDLYAMSNGDEFKAAFTLWGKAFLQVPAGSLPDDDRILAHLSGAGSRWSKVRGVALKGWIKCTDGRLYHSVVSEKALSAWEARKAQRSRTGAARAARALKNRQHAPGSTDEPNGNENGTAEPVTSSVTEDVTGSKGQGEGQGELRREDSGATHLPPATTVGNAPKGANDDLFGAAPPASPTPDARAYLFGWGLDTMKAMTGRTDDAVRRWLGKLLKALHDDAALLNGLIQQTVDNRPIDPTAWLSGAVRDRAGPGHAGKPEAFGHIAESPEAAFLRRYENGEIDEAGNEIRSAGAAPAPRDDGFAGVTLDGEAA